VFLFEQNVYETWPILTVLCCNISMAALNLADLGVLLQKSELNKWVFS